MKTESIKAWIPTSWADVSLRKYLLYRKNIELVKDEEGFEEKNFIIALDTLCGIEPQHTKKLSILDTKRIQADLYSFMGQSEFELQRIIDVGGYLYGFEPNLSQMPYGLYLDISKYSSVTIDENWAKIMSMLYRPLVGDKPKSADDTYQIKEYDGTLQPELFELLPMDIHFGCLFFFINLQRDLLRSTLKFLTQQKEMETLLPQILGRNGVATLRWLNSQMET